MPSRRKIKPQLLPQQLGQRTPISQVDPEAAGRSVIATVNGTIVFVGLGVRGDHPVVAFGAGHRGGEPDLVVGRLFVEDVGAVFGVGDCEDAGLNGWKEGMGVSGVSFHECGEKGVSAVCVSLSATYGELSF